MQQASKATFAVMWVFFPRCASGNKEAFGAQSSWQV
jgi:hypothetical protein